MSNGVTLSLPLSPTALRLGATLLNDMASQSEAIARELYSPIPRASDIPATTVNVIEDAQAAGTTVVREDAVDVLVAAITEPEETPEQRQFRLHGNVASAGMEPVEETRAITQETLPPVQYEEVITGYVDGAVPFAAGHNRESYEAAGWSIDALVNAGHLQAVVERVPLVDAPGACVAPSAPPPAPAPAPAAPAPTGTGVALDKAGLPYDTRIHSSAAEPLAKTGFWKRKKNISDDYVAQIEAELRAVMNAGKTPEPTTTTVAAAAPPAPSAAPAPAPSPAPAAPTAAPTGNAFAEFTRWLVGHTQAKRLTQTDAVLEVQKQGLSQIPDLAKRPDLIPAVVAALTAAKGL